MPQNTLSGHPYTCPELFGAASLYGSHFCSLFLSRFIQKQGLDRTFVQCDNHMWRVDSRALPPDISVDGGSDWIAIHRNYSRYLVTNKDTFLTDLKRYYQFTLLPAEVSLGLGGCGLSVNVRVWSLCVYVWHELWK